MATKKQSLLYKIGLAHNNSPLLLTLTQPIDYHEVLQDLVAGLFNKTEVEISNYLDSYNCLALDAIYLKKNDLETIFNFIQTKPLQKGFVKILVIENVQSLSLLLANALLKTLEELPSYLYLVLITNNPANVIGTIKSRCNVVHVNAKKPAKFTHPACQNLASLKTKALVASFGNYNNLTTFLDSESAKPIIEFFDNLTSHEKDALYLMQQNSIFNKFDYKQIKILINWLSAYYQHKNQSCFQTVIENYDLNLSKNYLYFCILELINQK